MKEKLRKLYLKVKKREIPMTYAIMDAWENFLNALYGIEEVENNFEKKLMKNLSQNSSIFIVRCFTIGVDSILACTIMSVILSLFNLVKWNMSLISSIVAGIICGAIILGFITNVAIIAYILIPAGKSESKRNKATSKFTQNIEENAYQIVEKICRIVKFVVIISIGMVLCTVLNIITAQQLAILLITLTIALFAISGIYLFTKCIIKGVFPNEEAIEDFFYEVEIKISSKGA